MGDGGSPDRGRRTLAPLRVPGWPAGLHRVHGHTPHAVVVVHDDGRWRVAYTTFSLDGTEHAAMRLWCFVEDWELPLTVGVSYRGGPVHAYRPPGHAHTNARMGRRVDGKTG